MFTSLKFGEKNDKLVDNIKKIQEQGEVRRRALQVTCEEFGVVNKSKLPIEDHADFDARVKELSEDIEQLDEISKKLVGRYIKKASDSVSKMSDASSELHRKSREYDTASKRAQNPADAGSHAVQKDETDRNRKVLNRKIDKTTDMLSLAASKLGRSFKKPKVLATEEVELNEISKKLVGRYISKASRSLGDLSVDALKHKDLSYHANSYDDHQKHRTLELKTAIKAHKRGKRIDHAVDRLTKEEVDPIVEAVVSKYIVESILAENKGGSKVKSFPHSKVMKNIKDGYWEASSDVKPGKHVEIRTHKNKKATIYVDHDPVKQ